MTDIDTMTTITITWSEAVNYTTRVTVAEIREALRDGLDPHDPHDRDALATLASATPDELAQLVSGAESALDSWLADRIQENFVCVHERTIDDVMVNVTAHT